MEIDKEADKFSGALLIELANIDPRLSKQITKHVERNPQCRENKFLRKAVKVALFFKEYPALYEEAAGRLRRKPEFYAPASNPKISVYYENVYHQFSDDPVPGSIESKYN